MGTSAHLSGGVGLDKEDRDHGGAEIDVLEEGEEGGNRELALFRFVRRREIKSCCEQKEETHPRLENIGEGFESDLLGSRDSVVSHSLLSEKLLVLPHPPNPLSRRKSREEDESDDSDGDGDAGIDLRGED